MKIKLLFLSFLFFSQLAFATMDGYISVYIPIANPQADLADKDGIILHKALFYTYYSAPESNIDAITWSFVANTPHKRYKHLEANLAHIKGLKVSLLNYGQKNCKIVIDSRNVVGNYSQKELDKILKYVRKATRLNMKEAHLNCKVVNLTKPKKVTNYSFPMSQSFKDRSKKVFPKLKSNFAQAPFVSDTFYQLGFSSDGTKFAYIIEHDNDPADFVHIETFIQDLVTDKILWKDSYRVNNSIGKDDFKRFWKRKKGVISKKLNSYNIEDHKPLSLTTGKMYYKNQTFTLDSLEKKRYAKDWTLNFLTYSKIRIKLKYRGYKTIDTKSYKFPSYILARKPMGSLGLGKRRAVIVGTVSRGWEGPPHNLHFEVVGVNLGVGFK